MRRSFFDLANWIERFRSDPTEVLHARVEWYESAVACAEDPEYSQAHTDSDFHGLTRVLVAWADQHGIDGAGALAEVHRQFCAYGRPGPPWGEPPPLTILQDTMARALVTLDRITDAAIIASKSLGRVPLVLTKDHVRILECLRKQLPQAMTIVELERASDRTRKTVNKWLQSLMEIGLARRLESRSGVTITTKGLFLVGDRLREFPEDSP